MDDKLNIVKSSNFKNFKKTKISQTDRDALQVMELNDASKWEEIQSKFKSLVKKYHPGQKIQKSIKTKVKKERIVLGYFSHDFGCRGRT